MIDGRARSDSGTSSYTSVATCRVYWLDPVVVDDELRQESRERGDVVAKAAYILLVERELPLRDAICNVIVSEPGFALAAACSSKDAALKVIEVMRLDIALISLDLGQDTALDVIRAAKSFQPLCEVLVMGTAEEKEGIFSSLQAGASGCLLKENFIHSERVRGSSIVRSLAFSRILAGLPAADEACTPKKNEISGLSSVQGDILRCVAGGLSNKEIARNLLMSPYNVDYHLKCLRKRFSVRNRVELTRAAMALLDSDTQLPCAAGRLASAEPTVRDRRDS
jgi:two-component system nitrate/nitrite response regulator NarL